MGRIRYFPFQSVPSRSYYSAHHGRSQCMGLKETLIITVWSFYYLYKIGFGSIEN